MDIKEFKKAMIDNDLNQSDLANILNTSKTNISNKLNGKSSFTLPQAQLIIKKLHLTKEQAYNIFFTQ